MQSQNVPDSVSTDLVVWLIEEEKEYLLQRVIQSIKVAKSNMLDPTADANQRKHWESEYRLGVRLLTKLGS